MLATLNNDKLVNVGMDMLLICVCRYVAWDCVPKYDGPVLATLPNPTYAGLIDKMDELSAFILEVFCVTV